MMNFRILNYLKHGRYRPTNLIESLFVQLLNLIYIRRCESSSFHILWYKKPPNSTNYYNKFGRFLLLIINFVSIVIFNKLLIKGVGVSDDVFETQNSGDNNTYWPNCKRINYKKKKLNNINEILKKIELQYEYSIQKKNQSDLPFWSKNRAHFKERFFDENGNILLNKIINFRNSENKYSSHLLSSHNIDNLDTRLNKLKALRIVVIYHKVAELVDDDIILNISDTNIGNANFIHYRKQLINERVLRQAYFLSQLRRKINIDKNEPNIFCDIGSGYALLPSILKNYYHKSKFIIVDLPELNILSYYYLKNLYPKSKICLSHEIKDIKVINKEMINQFDFIILEQDDLKKIDDEIIDCVINTASLGEMSKLDQDYYIAQIERLTKKYFYSVNRYDNENVLFAKSPSYYNFKLSDNIWEILVYKFSPTFHLEVILKKYEFKK
jgi:hypothetical protein